MSNRFDVPRCLPIHQKVMETENVATLSLVLPHPFKTDIIPGQYFMLWVPGDDEVPIAVSEYKENSISFTIFDVGKTSHSLVQSPVGTYIGLRGPFGNGFILENTETSVVIGGGIGLAPLRFLIHRLLDSGLSHRVILIEGARNKNSLVFRDEFISFPIETIFFTDDGSAGRKGFPTIALEEFLDNNLISSPEKVTIYACGPEMMLASIVSITNQNGVTHRLQVSLADRFIRCGFGVCGSCFLDEKGLSICHDGPVFRGDLVADLEDFGKWGRGSNGKKFPFRDDLLYEDTKD